MYYKLEDITINYWKVNEFANAKKYHGMRSLTIAANG